MSKSLSCTPSSISGKAGSTPVQLTVLDEAGHNLTPTVKYSSDDVKVATVTPRGQVSLMSAGSTRIKILDGTTSTIVNVSVS